MRILAISGSLRAASSNGAALRAAALIAPMGVKVDIYDSLSVLPPFNPDLDGDAPPEAILKLREEVGHADALLISSPEYAHGMPGSLKNLLDWLVRSLEFPGKPVALVNTSPRAHYAQAQLVEVLATMNANLVRDAFLTLPLLGASLSGEQIAADPDLSAELRKALAILSSSRHAVVHGSVAASAKDLWRGPADFCAVARDSATSVRLPLCGRFG